MIRIAQSTSRHAISVSGHGSEPRLEFSSTLIEFGPVLPHSAGDEKELVIKNPSSFPVEIYSLEFDKQYLEEEKVSWIHKCQVQTPSTALVMFRKPEEGTDGVVQIICLKFFWGAIHVYAL